MIEMIYSERVLYFNLIFGLVLVNTYIVRSYRVLFVASNIVTRRTNRAQIVVMYKIQKHH